MGTGRRLAGGQQAGFALAGALILVLAGCTSPWPSQGEGGIAELRPVPLTGEARIMAEQLSCLRSSLERFKHDPKGSVANATLPRAELIADRVTRELSGGLLGDARLDLVALRDMAVDLNDLIGIPNDRVAACGL